MVMEGPGLYPGAITGSHWYQDTYPGTKFEANVGVLHTTEGTTVPGYDGGAKAPNFTAYPDFETKKLRWYQHFDFDVSSRALANKAGGVETNTLNAVQIELVGTCDLNTHKRWLADPSRREHVFWPTAPDWCQLGLAKFIRWAYDEHGLRLASQLGDSPVVWRAYPGSYGTTTTRFTFAEWRSFYGWCGHQHVPENMHGDPGALPIGRILSFAKNKTWEDDMTVTDYEMKQIADAVLTRDGVIKNAGPDAEDNPYVALCTAVHRIEALARRNEKHLMDIMAKLTQA